MAPLRKPCLVLFLVLDFLVFDFFSLNLMSSVSHWLSMRFEDSLCTFTSENFKECINMPLLDFSFLMNIRFRSVASNSFATLKLVE